MKPTKPFSSRSSRASSYGGKSPRITKYKEQGFLMKAPFGIQTKRFAAIGYHPDLDPTGSMTADKNKISPCDYYPEKPECGYKKFGSAWDRIVKVEEFSKNLGFKNANILIMRKYMRSMGGPGNYDISDEYYKKKSCSILNDVNFGKNPRFVRPDINVPPPGTYFRKMAQTSTILKKKTTLTPTFEWDGFVDRFKGLNQSWKLAPNRYTPVDHDSIEAMVEIAATKKLPYCLFSGKRDGTSIKNHFAPPIRCSPDKYYDWDNGLNYLLKHPTKKRCGAFLKDQRFKLKPTLKIMMDDISTCYKDPDAPGPASYDIKTFQIKHLPDNKYPFNNSQVVVRKGVKWSIMPGPGRYNVKEPRCKYNDKKPSWVFKSTTLRTQYRAPVYSFFGDDET